MALVNRFTPEEKELDRIETLEMLKSGIAQAEIARQLGRSAQYISSLKENLISKKLITQEEIDIARQKALEKKQAAKKTINTKTLLKQEQKTKILAELKNGKTAIELINLLGIPSTTLRRYINELVEEGTIEDSDIVHQKEKNKENAKARNEAILNDIKSEQYTNIQIAKKYNVSETLVSYIAQDRYEEMIEKSSKKTKNKVFIPNPNLVLTTQEKEVLSWLLKGYQYGFIAIKIGLSQSELLKIVNVLKVKSAISSEQIRKAKEKKKISDENEVIKYLKSGFRQVDILNQKKEFNVAYLSRMISRLKEEKRITDEEIDEALAQDSDKLEFEKLVLKGMKQGLTVKQIINSDESRICY